MPRLFVAIRPPEAARNSLIDVMSDEPRFRWQSDDQLHLTLRFVGQVERPTAEDLAAMLRSLRFPRFSLRLHGLGCFEHQGGALWAGVEPLAEVTALAAKVERACQLAGLPPERRTFKPHITIARWNGRRGGEAHDFLAGRTLLPTPFAVDRFALFESCLSRHGAVYEEIESYSLG